MSRNYGIYDALNDHPNYLRHSTDLVYSYKNARSANNLGLELDTAPCRDSTHWELKLNVRDLLAEKVYYKQFAEVTYTDGSHKQVEEVSRCYKPGRNVGVQAVYKF